MIFSIILCWSILYIIWEELVEAIGQQQRRLSISYLFFLSRLCTPCATWLLGFFRTRSVQLVCFPRPFLVSTADAKFSFSGPIICFERLSWKSNTSQENVPSWKTGEKRKDVVLLWKLEGFPMTVNALLMNSCYYFRKIRTPQVIYPRAFSSQR